MKTRIKRPILRAVATSRGVIVHKRDYSFGLSGRQNSHAPRAFSRGSESELRRNSGDWQGGHFTQSLRGAVNPVLPPTFNISL